MALGQGIPGHSTGKIFVNLLYSTISLAIYTWTCPGNLQVLQSFCEWLHAVQVPSTNLTFVLQKQAQLGLVEVLQNTVIVQNSILAPLSVNEPF